MTLDTSSPEAFAISAAAVAWLVIQAILRPLFADRWAWFVGLSPAAKSAAWSLLILAVIVPTGWFLFDDFTVVLAVSLTAVLGAQGIHKTVGNTTESEAAAKAAVCAARTAAIEFGDTALHRGSAERFGGDVLYRGDVLSVEHIDRPP